MADVIQIRRDTAANWTSVNPVLHQGELGLETDTKKVKIGDGSSAWNSMPHASFDLPPLSDLYRVFHLTGDGIPQFPDNVAGAGYFNNIFANTDSWFSTNGTVSASNGILSSSYTSGSVFNLNRNITPTSGKEVVLLISKTGAINSVDFEYKISGTYYTIAGILVTEQFTMVPLIIPTAGDVDYIAIRGNGPSAGAKLNIKGIYIGSGLFDTPVFGKDGQSVWENHGVLPVNGRRGKAMLFQGKQYLESAVSQLGVSGVIHLAYSRKSTGISENIISNIDFTNHLGCGLYIYSGQQLVFNYGNGTNEQGIVLTTNLIADGMHTYVINYNQTTVGPVYRDGTKVLDTTVLIGTIKQSNSITRIGCPIWTTDQELLNGTLESIGFFAETWGADEAMRYHNGDDPVDCQQKSQTNTPYSLTVRDALGLIRQPGLSVYADNTAALAGGLVAGQPYRTSTGVLMIVY